MSRLRRWVDRRFYREAYEADAILSDLADNVRTIVVTRPLLETDGVILAGNATVQWEALTGKTAVKVGKAARVA